MLNIVGEDHPESEKMRAAEQDFARSRLGFDAERPVLSFYWLEHQFSENEPPEPAHEFGFASGVKFREYGDRPDLKARQHLLYLDYDLGLVQGYLQTAWPEAEKQKAPDRILGHARSAEIVLRFLIESFSERPDLKQVIEMKDHIEVFGKVQEACTTLQNQPSETLTEWRGLIRQLMKALGDKTVTGRHGEKMKSAIEEMSTQRSAHMFNVAADSRRVGVWKVGEEHIKHMQPLSDDAENVEFTDRGPFQTEVRAFLETKKAEK